jgi:hypothetical protein
VRPAERLDVDWAELGYVLPGVLRRVSALVAVLPYSRMIFVTFSLSHAMGAFLRCMDRALRFFGGRAALDVFDNMKTVVTGRFRGEPILHPTMVEYARVHGFAVSATKPRHPTGKPFVERGIGFLRTQFLPGARFSDLPTLERDAIAWRDTFANAREHEATGKVPALVLEHSERHALLPLREVHFDTDDVLTTSVGRTHQIGFDRNQYTVPWRLAGQRVLVRGDDDRVRVLLGHKQVCSHTRSWSAGTLITDASHEQGMREERRRGRLGELPDALGALGPSGEKYFALLAASRRSLRLKEQRLVLLAELVGVSATTSAIDEVMKTGHVGAEYVEHTMRFKRRPSPAPLRLGNPALDSLAVREPDLAVYDEICARRRTRAGRSTENTKTERQREGPGQARCDLGATQVAATARHGARARGADHAREEGEHDAARHRRRARRRREGQPHRERRRATRAGSSLRRDQHRRQLRLRLRPREAQVQGALSRARRSRLPRARRLSNLRRPAGHRKDPSSRARSRTARVRRPRACSARARHGC